MIIGVIADTHDHMRNIRRALVLFERAGAEAIVHAGDVVAPFAAKAFAAFPRPVYAVFGNNDGERAGLSRVLDIVPAPRTVALGGRTIVVAHEAREIPDDARLKADVVITAHTHVTATAAGARPLAINPGEAGGWLYGRATCMLLDTDTLEAELLEIPEA
jgi:putative phosphoesterase